MRIAHDAQRTHDAHAVEHAMVECRSECNEYDALRAADAHASRTAVDSAVSKAQSEAERLHACLMRVAQAEAKATHDVEIVRFQSELNAARRCPEQPPIAGHSGVPLACAACPIKQDNIDKLAATVQSVREQLAMTVASAATARHEHTSVMAASAEAARHAQQDHLTSVRSVWVGQRTLPEAKRHAP